MKTTLQYKIVGSAIAATVLTCMLPMACLAQSAKTGSNATGSPAAAEAPPASPGLDATLKTNESKVLTELVNDGLETLLHRRFDVDNTPDPQREAIESLGAIRLLNQNVQMSDRMRLTLVGQAAKGLEGAKANLPHDSATLEKYARTLIADGETYYESTLEYWGENPVTEANLNPIANAVCDLYKMASDAAEEECTKAANQNHLDKARDFDNQSQFDTYIGALKQYDRALAADASTPDGKALRKKICDKALSDLLQYDDPSTTVQPVVELNMGKDYMLEGKTEEANKKFDNLIGGKTTPKATPDQLNDAYYFKAVASVLANDPASARKALDSMVVFQKTLPDLLAKANWKPNDIADFVKGSDTDNQLLQYRIGLADAALAKTPADKDKATTAAARVLEDLAQKRPELQYLIYEQLVNCLPQNQPVAQMDPLLLEAVTNKGRAEFAKPEGQRDKALIQRGLDAAKEILSRKNQKGIDPEVTLGAYKTVPMFDVALGKELDAANAYLDFAEKYKNTTHETDADPMVHRAYGCLEDVRAKDPTVPGLADTYERFYQLAVTPPFNYTMFYYAYAQMLKGQEKLEAAANLLKQVPANDNHYASARWDLLQVDSTLVDNPTKNADAHKKLVDETVKVADELRTRLAKATDLRQRYQAAWATLLAARLAINDQDNPKTALDLLQDYEKQIAGLDAINTNPKAASIEKTLLIPCMFIRYRGHMATKQNDAATADLLAIMKDAPGDQGAKMVHDQLDDLHKQYEKAVAADNKNEMRDLARNQGKLSSVLAEWARTNPDPNNKKAYYYYGVQEANNMRIAGSLEEAASAAKEQDLKEALAKYKFFESKDGHAMYLDQLDPAKKSLRDFDPTHPDVNVEFGLALTQYQLHDYADAQSILSDLLANGELGSTSADTYWEGTYTLYDCNYQLAKQGNADAKKNLNDTKQGLMAIYIVGGIPPQWQGDFDALRAKLLPDWKVPAAAGPQQSASR